MGILILLVPLTVLMSACGVIAYIWACRNRQFDDLETPRYNLLFDESTHKDRDK